MTPFKVMDFGSLKALYSENGENLPTVCLLHGYGADFQDLAGIAMDHPNREDFNWVFPQAPLSVFGMGRAWFPITQKEMESIDSSKGGIGWEDRIPEGIFEAQEALTSCLKELGVPNNSLILGGFSQGSVMAVDYALRQSLSLLGLVIFSGTICMKKQWSELLNKNSLPSFIQSHGTDDALLGFEDAKKLFSLLEANSKGEFFKFSGGHEIPNQVLKEFICYTNERK
jgi:phospholipase/carboxylesterase